MVIVRIYRLLKQKDIVLLDCPHKCDRLRRRGPAPVCIEHDLNVVANGLANHPHPLSVFLDRKPTDPHLYSLETCVNIGTHLLFKGSQLLSSRRYIMSTTRVGADLVSCSAEKLVDRAVKGLTNNVPDRSVDGAHRHDSFSTIEGLPGQKRRHARVELVPDPLIVKGIFSHNHTSGPIEYEPVDS